MRNGSANIVFKTLHDMIERLDDGARLPTVRDLMKKHQVSQATVQEALDRLRGEGLLVSQVGRGTYVTRGGGVRDGETGRENGLDSLLILSNASMNERCIRVQSDIVQEMSRHDAKVVQISYHHTDHLLEILSSIPDFDAVVLQSHYESIPIRLLHLLQQKTKALVVDGHTVAGVDVDRIGTDWEDALEMALRHLIDLGHRSFGLVSINTVAQPILAARRAFGRHAVVDRDRFSFHPPIVLDRVHHPSHGAQEAVVDALAPLLSEEGRLPFTALLTLGISDTLGFTQGLRQLGIACPEQLSVVVLGHRDVPTEHLGVMTIAGSSQRKAAEKLVEAIRRRIEQPLLAPQIVYLRCDQVVRESTASPSAG
ncbi:HTH gntR-type domain-containing protein [Hyphomicrobiales bacterium]|nr:HTH gntR-type domain-containing protein [Hyphomicrobiales bacterium]CAH1702058.1 HTH gntR-type domain-containing protein [Hyphomicrobiales bacterium]CAI0346215.1 HTH gntR-type domain-containing protein [Hyphomicrobiales bacterium]